MYYTCAIDGGHIQMSLSRDDGYVAFMDRQRNTKLLKTNEICNYDPNCHEFIRKVVALLSVSDLREDQGYLRADLFSRVGCVQKALLTADVRKDLASMYLNSPEHQKLKLEFTSESKIDSHFGWMIKRIVRANTNITEVSFYGATLKPSVIRRLAPLFLNHRTLREISLKEAALGHKSAQIIANHLRINDTLRSLDLEGNFLGNTGTIAIAEALENNTTLEELNLTANDIGPRGAAAIASKVLVGNTGLEWLSIGFNRLGDEGASQICKAIENNNTLKHLGVNYTDLKSGVISSLFHAFRGDNRTLSALGDKVAENPVVTNMVAAYKSRNGYPYIQLRCDDTQRAALQRAYYESTRDQESSV